MLIGAFIWIFPNQFKAPQGWKLWNLLPIDVWTINKTVWKELKLSLYFCFQGCVYCLRKNSETKSQYGSFSLPLCWIKKKTNHFTLLNNGNSTIFILNHFWEIKSTSPILLCYCRWDARIWDCTYFIYISF